jgi:hypothetical protein
LEVGSRKLGVGSRKPGVMSEKLFPPLTSLHSSFIREFVAKEKKGGYGNYRVSEFGISYIVVQLK